MNETHATVVGNLFLQDGDSQFPNYLESSRKLAQNIGVDADKVSIQSLGTPYRNAVCMVSSLWVSMCESLILLHVNNKAADQSAHLHSLISAFVIPFMESIITKPATSKKFVEYNGSVGIVVFLTLKFKGCDLC